MFLYSYAVIVLCSYVSLFLESYVLTLPCVSCIFSQDDLPDHVLSQFDGAATKKQKTEVVRDLFVKGKEGGWVVDMSKPRFQQDPRGRACYSQIQ